MSVIILIFCDIFIDRMLLSRSFKDRFFANLVLQISLCGISLVLASISTMLFLNFAKVSNIYEKYINYLISITSGELAEVGGMALLQLILGICITTLLFYSLIFYFGKKHLIKVGILNSYKLERINSLSVNGNLNSVYTIVIFWTGFVPLFLDAFGGAEYTINGKWFLAITLSSAIPYTHINIMKMLSSTN